MSDRKTDPVRDGGDPRTGRDARTDAPLGSMGTMRDANEAGAVERPGTGGGVVKSRVEERRRAAIDEAVASTDVPRHAGPKAASAGEPGTDGRSNDDDVRSGHKRRGGKRRRRRGTKRAPSAAPLQPDAATSASAGARANIEGLVREPAEGVQRPRLAPDGPKSRSVVGRPKLSTGIRPTSVRTPLAHGGPPVPGRARWRPVSDDAPLYAALDLGTNNCRLLIATPGRRGQFRVVDAFSRIVKLGEGLGATNALDRGAMNRAVDALKTCADKLAGRRIRRRRLIATEACRRAANGAQFIERVRREAGLSLEVIDRRTEAHLAVAGCSSLVDRRARGVVLFDIGGGSTEVALLDLGDGTNRSPERSIAGWTSLPVGVVTLSERFEGMEITPAVFERMVQSVSEMLAGFGERQRLRRYHRHRHFHLLGTSGTVTTLAGIHLALPRYDRRQVDGLWMSSEEVDAVQHALVHSSYAERRAHPCIGTDRADLVLAGSAILEAIRREWPAERLRVADRGLREGMLSDMMVSDDAWSRARPGGNSA